MHPLLKILNKVSEATNIPVSDLTGESHKRKFSEARSLYALLARELTQFSFPQIGLYLKRKHCTIIQSYKTGLALKEQFKDFLRLYEELKKELIFGDFRVHKYDDVLILSSADENELIGVIHNNEFKNLSKRELYKREVAELNVIMKGNIECLYGF